MPSLGVLLKHLRDRKQLTLADLEKTTGLSDSYLSELETGTKHFLSEDKAELLIAALDPPARELFMFRNLWEHHQHIRESIVTYALAHSEVTAQQYSWAVAIQFRLPTLDDTGVYILARIFDDIARFAEEHLLLTRAESKLPGSAPTGKY